MNSTDLIAAEAQYLVQTYARPDRVFTHGRGATLCDSEGRKYLDFAAGIAVTALGHSDPEWAQAISEQARQLAHVSNLYHTVPQVELARRLVENSFADRVFFCNSGGEANEAALKFARKYARSRAAAGSQPFAKTNLVAFTGGFHGRTMGALAVTHKAKYREPFAPLLPGVTFATFNDLASAQAAVNGDTCAVIVEPVQGEGGINPATPDFLQGLRALCNEHDALLIFDEVQCGLGRTGRLWAHEAAGVTADVMTLAKPLAGGLPIGAVLVTEAVAGVMKPGDHGSTFAGGPLVCTAAKVVFDRVNQPAFLADVAAKGQYLQNLLADLPGSKITAIRGAGLMVGVEFSEPVAPLITAARDKGLIIINAGDNVIRLCPPLIISREQIETAVAILGSCLSEL